MDYMLNILEEIPRILWFVLRGLEGVLAGFLGVRAI